MAVHVAASFVVLIHDLNRSEGWPNKSDARNTDPPACGYVVATRTQLWPIPAHHSHNTQKPERDGTPRFSCERMVDDTGLEPVTPGM